MILLWDSSDMVVRFVLVHEGSHHAYEWAAGRTLARDMLAHLRDSLALHGKTLADIEQIGVCRGPGSFTGLRIGLTVLNTIAAAQHIPIVGASGDDWQSVCRSRLERGDDDRLVMPEYGSDAHTTKPRK